MNLEKSILANKVLQYDAVMLRVLSEPEPQHLHAQLLHIYSARKGMAHCQPGDKIRFLQAPNSWGAVPMVPGETAIVFLTLSADQFYEAPWQGHLIIEDIEGKPFASFPHRELWLSENLPPSVCSQTRQDPKRTYASAMALAPFEDYLHQLIAYHS